MSNSSYAWLLLGWGDLIFSTSREVCNWIYRTERYSGDFSSPKGNLDALRKKEMKDGDVHMGIYIHICIYSGKFYVRLTHSKSLGTTNQLIYDLIAAIF